MYSDTIFKDELFFSIKLDLFSYPSDLHVSCLFVSVVEFQINLYDNEIFF